MARSMLADLSPRAILMGLLATFTGFASSFAVVLEGLRAVGASEAQAASGLMALSVAMGLCAILLSLRLRLPISIAWSTPGAALLVATGTPEGGFPAAVGAFLICAGLIIVAGLWRPFGRAVEAIPSSLANAMLAGVLLGLCLAPFQAIAFEPLFGLPILLAWIIAGRVNRLLAVPAALLAFIAVVVFGIEVTGEQLSGILSAARPAPVFVAPTFELATFISLAVPLFIVTMASQNIPGLAVLRANHYETPPGPLIATAGAFSLIGALFGGHGVNLAAITAAMCAGEEAHADPARRYWAAAVAGMAYVILGLLAGLATAFVALAPAILIQAVAGLALIGAFVAAASAAWRDESQREAAAVTFLTTASGITLFGVSGAFWGLVAGGAIIGLSKFRATRT